MNIACFDKNIDMDWVVECAHVANIHDDIINTCQWVMVQ